MKEIQFDFFISLVSAHFVLFVCLGKKMFKKRKREKNKFSFSALERKKKKNKNKTKKINVFLGSFYGFD